jgi:ribosome-associated toxin RatA of RatAB toxin-antitoxin module
MQSIWEFHEVEGCTDQCEICFTTEFEFRSALYSQVAGYFLDFVASKNMEAFMSRLSLVYGPAPNAETQCSPDPVSP